MSAFPAGETCRPCVCRFVHVHSCGRVIGVSGDTIHCCDKQGRILVPKEMRDYAALEREVTIAGMGPKIELWNTARYAAKFNQTQARFPEISASLAAKLGN